MGAHNNKNIFLMLLTFSFVQNIEVTPRKKKSNISIHAFFTFICSDEENVLIVSSLILIWDYF